MNRIALALFAAAGFAVTSARADRVDIQGSVNFGSPGYVAPVPGYYAPGYYAPRGYWRDVPVNVWVPPHWEVRTNEFGQPYNYFDAGHYITRMQRVWVNGYADPRMREWQEHEWREREWREQHERREREEHRDRDWDR